MDFLSSLNVEDLPEQQTRVMEIMQQYPELNVRLGFDACCACATPLSNTAATTGKVTCPLCRRVDYCSEACRVKDSQALVTITNNTVSNNAKLSSTSTPATMDDEPGLPEEETAGGHSSIICSLLRLCQDDEDVQAKEAHHMDAQRREAAQDRIQSELESYPATLANVLAQGPCYQPILAQCRQDKEKTLTIHIVGATVEAELMAGEDYDTTSTTTTTKDDDADVDANLETATAAYAEALADLAETNHLRHIQLYLLGPDCPATNTVQQRSISTSSSNGPRSKTNGHKANGTTTTATGSDAVVTLQTFRGVYNSQLLHQHDISAAHVVVFFNPGFTVPEYEWIATLQDIPTNTPFLSTTNTEMEGIADCQFLLDQDKIQTIPHGLAQLFGLYSSPDEANEEGDNGDMNGGGGAGHNSDDWMQLKQEAANRETSFFTVNPFCGTRVRQSGTMANDVFVKNRWMLGGVLGSFDPSSVARQQQEHDHVNTKKRRTVEHKDNGNDNNNNTKSTNPALI